MFHGVRKDIEYMLNSKFFFSSNWNHPNPTRLRRWLWVAVKEGKSCQQWQLRQYFRGSLFLGAIVHHLKAKKPVLLSSENQLSVRRRAKAINDFLSAIVDTRALCRCRRRHQAKNSMILSFLRPATNLRLQLPFSVIISFKETAKMKLKICATVLKPALNSLPF